MDEFCRSDYLVLVSGGFFYAIGAVLNAKATPDTTQLQTRTAAESMFVWHKTASEILKTTPGPIYSLQSGGPDYKDTRWKAEKLPNSCKLVYKLSGATLDYPHAITSELIRYVNQSRSVGYIDKFGVVTVLSQKGPDSIKNFVPADARNTPFIFEC